MERVGRPGLRQRAAGGGDAGGGFVLIEARLQGGAPWGFTVQGGLEHEEPLIISKVEEGGKADRLEQPLLVGDEIIIINEVELSGYRQEAIALVKGSYKTLQLTVRREFDPGYVEEFGPSCPSLPALPLPHQHPHQDEQQTSSSSSTSSHHSRPSSAGGVQLRIKNRRSEPASRPHSWHSTKLCEGQQEVDAGAMDTLSNAWHHGYHPSASTSDLSGRFDPGGTYLRKSPDQYSSRGSMESLDPPPSSQHHSAAQYHHALGHHTHGGHHSAYSSCHQLSSARSSNSIDHLHSKRDSAYSSFSTSSSIPEYLASTPSFSPERSYSLETVSQRGGGSGEMQQADICYVRTVYDGQRGLSQEHELSSASAAFLRNSNSRSGVEGRQSREHQVGGVCYRGSSSGSSSSGSSGGGMPASNRHSVGPIWGPATGRSSFESLKGAPAPPRRSDSYAAIRNHDRPNSWSSLEHARSLRSLQKGSWHHSSGPVASSAAKGSYSAEGQLHTVIEKSPESSPTTKPRQGGAYPQSPPPPPPPPGPSSGPAGAAHPSGRFIAQHHAHMMPGVGPAKEGGRQQHPGVGRREDGAAEAQMDGRMSATENGYQNTSSASGYARTHAHEEDRHQQEESSFGLWASEGHTRAQRAQNQQAHHSHQGQVFRDQNQDFHVSHGLRGQSSQEWRDTSPPVHPMMDRSRSIDQSSVHSEPLVSARIAQGQAPPPNLPEPQAPPTSASKPSARHLSDSAALQYQHWEHREHWVDGEREHPLTRLENALAEVQRCASPDGSYGDGGGQGPTRSLSVLEKVSRFERRDRAVKQRSHSTINSHGRAGHTKTSEKGHSSACGADDLRNMLERSTNPTKAHRTLSFRGGAAEQVKYRTPADPSSALQRSRSSFQLEDSRPSDGSKDFSWRQDVQETLQDSMFNSSEPSRSYRKSLKDAQSKVLRSTSFKRRDLNSSTSPPPSAPPPVSAPGGPPPPSMVAKHPSPEKKGPKTMPKPQGVVITPQSPPPVTSPHTPKERHAVGPEVRGPSPPSLPSVPPVGPPALLRICGRKRLAADQKKRSYSEPENMNEVGVSDAETTALFRRGGETSVADRRRMFELGVGRVSDGAPQNATPRPDLRQLQHDALAEYVERKRSVKRHRDGPRDGGPRDGGPRPRSAFMRPDSCSFADALSLSSASSLLSLQDSARPAEADPLSFQSNLYYPGRVTTPRPPVPPVPQVPPQPRSPPAPSELEALMRQDLGPAVGLGGDPGPESPLGPGLSRQLNGALQRAGSARGSGKSASAEDLLERSEERQMTPQHSRSRSSPTADRLNQDFPPGDVRMFGVFISEPGRDCLAGDRPADSPASGGLVALQSPNIVQPAGPSQDPSSAHTPVTRRERQRNGERQRASGASTLAASVGLPCPFLSPPGARDGGGAEWHAGERLSRANLSAITFPGDGDDEARQTARSLSDGDVLEDVAKEAFRERAFSLELRGRHDNAEAPPTPANTQDAPSVHQRLISLRISESSLLSPAPPPQTGPPQDDLDDVFLQSPAPPPPPPPPIQEMSIVEEFPPPPPPTELEHQTDGGLPSVRPQSAVTSAAASALTDDGFGLEYEPLPRREKTTEELQVEALAGQLVLQDGSLASLFDTWGSKSTVELMEEIFQSGRLAGKSPWQQRGSSRTDDRICDGVATATCQRTEANQDDDDKTLNAKKVELCEALQRSVAALRQEKERLCEEQRCHQALGASVETLVQERLKANERDKYSMFIGDLEKIVNLLLSLCSRMSRIDRSLLALQREELTEEDAAEERESLHHKRSLLLAQTDDARELKENLDRRQRVVQSILSGYLSEPQLRDYRRFVSGKPSLLIRQRHLDNLIRQAEEQLTRVSESLPPELARAHGWTRAGPFSTTTPSPAPCSLLFPPLLQGHAHSVRSTTVTTL